jgi:hypothetical protein
MLTTNILARKSGEGPVPYCKTRAESEGFNRRGSVLGILAGGVWSGFSWHRIGTGGGLL